MLFLHILILVVTVAVLIKSADYFVESSSNIAKAFGISNFVIGLTLVAVGTSLPELAASIVASLQGFSDIAIGNVVGSNIANILLVVGASAVVAGLTTHREMLDRDGLVMVASSILFYWFLVLEGFTFFMDSPFAIRFGGALMIILFFAYLMFISWSKKHVAKESTFEEFVRYVVDAGFIREIGVLVKRSEITRLSRKDKGKHDDGAVQESGVGKHFLLAVLSCAGIVVSAKFFVGEAIWLSDFFGVSGGVVGMTIVALGTSLPELAVSVVAAKKGMGDMVIGNILGSNIANILLVGGTSLLIAPMVLAKSTLMFTLPFMVFASVLLLVFIRIDWKIKRVEGLFFLMLYGVFLALVYKGLFV